MKVPSLGWKDPLEEGMATHASVLAWRIPKDRGAWWATVRGVTKSDAKWLSKQAQGWLICSWRQLPSMVVNGMRKRHTPPPTFLVLPCGCRELHEGFQAPLRMVCAMNCLSRSPHRREKMWEPGSMSGFGSLPLLSGGQGGRLISVWTPFPPS